MKIAFTTSGENLEAPLDPRFGRAPRCLVYNLDDDTFEVVDNQQNLNAAQGAGIQAAEMIVHTGARCVVTGHCGPKAFRALHAGGVTVYNSELATVAEALEAFRSGALTPAAAPNVEGHSTA